MGRTAPAHLDSGNATSPRRGFGSGYLCGIPLGELGWFGSLLIAVASGFLAFFATTFLAIFGILFFNAGTHRALDLSYSYSRVGLPCGAIVLTFASVYLARLWIRRILGRS